MRSARFAAASFFVPKTQKGKTIYEKNDRKIIWACLYRQYDRSAKSQRLWGTPEKTPKAADRFVKEAVKDIKTLSKDVIIKNITDKRLDTRQSEQPQRAEAVVVITEDKKQKLKNVFWDMHEITSRTETAANGDTNEKVVYITITEKTKDDMISQYNFTRKQRSIHF